MEGFAHRAYFPLYAESKQFGMVFKCEFCIGEKSGHIEELRIVFKGEFRIAEEGHHQNTGMPSHILLIYLP